MKKISELNLPKDLGYTKEHIWAKKEPDGQIKIGVSDYAQDQLGEVAYVDLPEPGTKKNANEEFGSIESVKSVNSLYMPVSGEITEVNENLADAPEEVNADPYGKGWIAKIKPDQPNATDNLMTSQAYMTTLAED